MWILTKCVVVIKSYPHLTVRIAALFCVNFPDNSINRLAIPRMVTVRTGDDPDCMIRAGPDPDAALSVSPPDPHLAVLNLRLVLRDQVFRDGRRVPAG